MQPEARNKLTEALLTAYLRIIMSLDPQTMSRLVQQFILDRFQISQTADHLIDIYESTMKQTRQFTQPHCTAIAKDNKNMLWSDRGESLSNCPLG